MIHDVAPVSFVVVYFRQDSFKKEKKRKRHPYVGMFVYVLAWAPPCTFWWVMTGERRSCRLKLEFCVICSVNCSALLIIQDLEKGWGLPFNPPLRRPRSRSLLPRSPCSVSRTWSGRRMKERASPQSACHRVIRPPWDDYNMLEAFPVCAFLGSRCSWMRLSIATGAGRVQFRQELTQTHTHMYPLISLSSYFQN